MHHHQQQGNSIGSNGIDGSADRITGQSPNTNHHLHIIHHVHHHHHHHQQQQQQQQLQQQQQQTDTDRRRAEKRKAAPIDNELEETVGITNVSSIGAGLTSSAAAAANRSLAASGAGTAAVTSCSTQQGSQQRSTKRKVSTPTSSFRSSKRPRRPIRGGDGAGSAGATSNAMDESTKSTSTGSSNKRVSTSSTLVLIKSPSSNPANVAVMATDILRTRLTESYPFKMPQDFYDLYTYCALKNSSFPKRALTGMIDGLVLCGPYDYSDSQVDDWRLHCRFYYDPPQFTSVAYITGTGIHIGYYRDAPDELPSFLASNDEADSRHFKRIGKDIFSALLTLRNAIKQDNDVYAFDAPQSTHCYRKHNQNSEVVCSNDGEPLMCDSLDIVGELDVICEQRSTTKHVESPALPLKTGFCVLINGLVLHLPSNYKPKNSSDFSMSNDEFVNMLDRLLLKKKATSLPSPFQKKAQREAELERKKAHTDFRFLLMACNRAAANPSVDRQYHALLLKTALNMFAYGAPQLAKDALKLAKFAFNAILSPKYQLFASTIEAHLNHRLYLTSFVQPIRRDR